MPYIFASLSWASEFIAYLPVARRVAQLLTSCRTIMLMPLLLVPSGISGTNVKTKEVMADYGRDGVYSLLAQNMINEVQLCTHNLTN